MEGARMGPLMMIEHRAAALEPWVHDVLRFRNSGLRAAANLQASSRKPVVWHPLIRSGCSMRKSCFSPLSTSDISGH